MAQLSARDLKAFTQESSPEVRGALAEKIAIGYRTNSFTPAEADVAADIFRILLKDAAVKIRRCMAEQLAHCPHAPHDIILKLAQDDSEVALPVLEYSTVLTEDDLIAIVKSTREVIKLCAITRRETISEALSGALIDTYEIQVLQDLFGNKGAMLGEQSLLGAWDVVSASPFLLETLVDRGGLPLAVAEKILHAVGEDLKKKLNRQYKFSTPLIQKTVNDAREWELLGITKNHSKIDPRDDELVEDLVDDLYLNGRLTHSLLMRALCVGNLSVFEAGIARLASVPRINARILLMECSGRGLDAIYTAAAMPEGFMDAVRVLLRISLEETDFGHTHRDDFSKRVIERIYMGRYNHNVENMDYVLTIIGGRLAAHVTTH